MRDIILKTKITLNKKIHKILKNNNFSKNSQIQISPVQKITNNTTKYFISILKSCNFAISKIYSSVSITLYIHLLSSFTRKKKSAQKEFIGD